MTKTDRIIAATEAVTAHNYSPLPVVIERGAGVWVWDVEGKKYLDCISAYSAVNQGHCHPRIVAALRAQADRLTLTSRAVHNDRMGGFLERLCKLAAMDAALPMNTGAEGVETAIKLARKWGYQRKHVARDRAEIIVCRNNFHGRTTTVVGFSSEPQYRDDFGPYGPGFTLIDFGDAAALERAITPATVAFLVEPIQAEAGILIPPDGYLRAARRICKASNVLFMLDEIQTGLGRTGRMFAYEHESDAKPDVLILGKALGGGLYPVSVVLARREVMDVFAPGDHGSTFGGNPLAAAAGEAALAVIVDEKLAERAARSGEALLRALAEIDSPHVAEIRGRGLLVGIELARSSGPARDFALQLLEHDVLCKDTHAQVLRLAPPLVI
ncbi:MAG TPA: ornithine--oxo-acid transaminase, partial [Gammaproteobacteria bacterium]